MTSIPRTRKSRTAKPKKQTPRRVSHNAMARVYGMRSQRQKKIEPFAINMDAVHPHAKLGHNGGPSIAMDTSVTDSALWAGTNILADMYNEGLSFLGYPALALMAQRPEYRRMAETIARHMTRKWIKFKSKSGKDLTDLIGAVEDELTRLKAQEVFKKAIEQDNLFGRSHVFMELCPFDDYEERKLSVGNGSNAMSRAKVGKDSLKSLRPVEAVWCYPNNYNATDPLHPYWYKPQSWFIMNHETHTSRLLTFVGREVPDLLKPAYSFGGLSLSQICKPYVDNWLRTRQNVADIVQAFSVFVMKTNVIEQLEGDASGLVDRLTTFNQLRDNAGIFAIDKDAEDFANVSAPLGGLDLLQAQTQEHMSAASGIPIVELLGISPTGLNASSEGEIKVFYDWIHACQEAQLRPNLEKLVGFIQLSLGLEPNDDLIFDFEPLDTLDPSEEATRQNTIADVHSKYIEMGVITPDEVRETVATDEDSLYNNIDLTGPAPGVPGEEEGGMPGEPPMPDPHELAKGDPNDGEGEAPDETSNVAPENSPHTAETPEAPPAPAAEATPAPTASAGKGKRIKTSIGDRTLHPKQTARKARVRK